MPAKGLDSTALDEALRAEIADIVVQCKQARLKTKFVLRDFQHCQLPDYLPAVQA